MQVRIRGQIREVFPLAALIAAGLSLGRVVLSGRADDTSRLSSGSDVLSNFAEVAIGLGQAEAVEVLSGGAVGTRRGSCGTVSSGAATSEASRKEGGVYGVRDGGGACSSDVTHGTSGVGLRYPVKAPYQLASLCFSPLLTCSLYS